MTHQAGTAEPAIGVKGAEPTMWPDRMVDALIIKPCEELDQHAWRESIRTLSLS